MSACRKLADIVYPTIDKDLEVNPVDSGKNFLNNVVNEGSKCMQKYFQTCNDVCENSTLYPQRCYNCLKNKETCQSSTDNTQACCPNIQYAVECARDINKSNKDTTEEKVKDALKNHNSKTGKIVGISIGSVGGLIVIIIVIVLLRRKKRKAQPNRGDEQISS